MIRRLSTRMIRRLSTSSSYRASLLSLRSGAFAKPAEIADLQALQAASVVVIGEIHSVPPCVELTCRAASGMLEVMEEHRHAKLHIVLEHFNFEMQPLLDAFSGGSLSLTGLADGAKAEGHDLDPYAPLLTFAQQHSDHVALHVREPNSNLHPLPRSSLNRLAD